MTFSTVLQILALIAFILAAVGWKYRKTEPLTIGLALWSLSELIGMNFSRISTLVLLLAFIAFVVAAIGLGYKKLNLIAIGLALWMVSLLLEPLLHIS